ncbi:hypothetical protein [Leptospira meyeri]|uniref:hypothetical protein n=1 Tax=Leptospira meyeri TaxID=29508 RepID=UPI000C2B29BB|nr:hypothetical protein [Leptospira meyeri]PJZ82142.1 hypothetical protein CH359_04185 [Leptospira meyeri]PJZ97646.1 hypothetical protein CH358_01225 [Leptospira meyeri]TGM66579.1 hypothetical protein EHQ93_00725 [Leptospira meyeri]TGM73817.1 hypothetical protein EHQ94_01450 [Leptospira meyeri]
MKYEGILLIILFANTTFCKKEELVLKPEKPFYINSSETCNLSKTGSEFPCIQKKEDLACYAIFKKAESFNIDQIFRNTKWTSPDLESTFNYYFNNQNNMSILEGGPSRNISDFIKIGKGKIYQENRNWIYEQYCDDEKCEELKFLIEYVGCSLIYSDNSNEHRLFLTIGNRYYDQYDDPNKRKFLSIVLEDPVKPQLENGFELYLVPPPPK